MRLHLALPFLLLSLHALNAVAQDKPLQARTEKVKLQEFGESLDGFLEPVPGCELSPLFKTWKEQLVLKFIAADGGQIKKGDLIASFDAPGLDQSITATEASIKELKINLELLQERHKTEREHENLILDQAQNRLAKAKADLEYFENVDGKNLLEKAEADARRAKERTDDLQEELDQLVALYQQDDLTKATSEIVLGRHRRQIAAAKESQEQAERVKGKVIAFDHPNLLRNYKDAIENARIALDVLRLDQRDRERVRERNLANAQAALQDAEKHLEALRLDRSALELRATSDGLLVHGRLRETGVWDRPSADGLRVGMGIAANQPFITLCGAEALRLRLEIPEDRVQAFHNGSSGELTLVSAAGLRLRAVCESIAAAGIMRVNRQMYASVWRIEGLPATTLPGARARLQAGLDGLVQP